MSFEEYCNEVDSIINSSRSCLSVMQLITKVSNKFICDSTFDIYDVLEFLVSEEKIVLIEYSVPGEIERVKTLVFPKSTDVNYRAAKDSAA